MRKILCASIARVNFPHIVNFNENSAKLHYKSCMQHIVCLHATSCKHKSVVKTKKITTDSKKNYYQNSDYEVHQVGLKNFFDGNSFFAQIMFFRYTKS
jgi:hypothetical protein